jgi:hypothetical protein
MTNALVPAQPRTLSMDVWQMISQVAPTIYAARIFGVANTEQAAAIMLKGYELGFGLAASFEFVKPIMGKPELIPRGALAILHGSPEMARIEIRRLTDNTGVYIGHECYMKRRSGFEYTVRWTLADAQRAGLVKAGSAWESYPENMCLWRAVGFCADVVAPDLTAGATLLMKAPEQFGVAFTEGGDVIEGQARPAEPLDQVDHTTLLNQMMDAFGPQVILDNNGGEIPNTPEAIQAVAKALRYPW